MLSYNPALFNAAASRLFLTGAREAAGESYVPLLATVVESTHRSELYARIGDAPAMTEFKGEVQFNPATDATVTVPNKTYTAGFEVKEDDYEDDVLNGFAEALLDMGQEAVLLPNSLLIQAIIDGSSATASLPAGYDGVALFSDSHPARGAAPAQDNILAGTGTTVAQVQADLNGKVIAGLRGFRRENGRYANRVMTDVAIVFPPAIRQTMIEAINASVVANTENVATRMIKWTLIEDPQLEDSDANNWYAFVVSTAARALVLQQRTMFQLLADPAHQGTNFTKEVRRWKSRWRGAVAPGPWYRGVTITNT